MSIDLNALQAAVIAAAREANVCDGRVYDVPPWGQIEAGKTRPTKAAYPYVELAAALNTEDDASVSEGVEVILTFNAWSEHQGFRELNSIWRAFKTALHDQALTIGDATANLFLDSYQPFDAPDGVTRQGVLRLRCQCRT